MSWIKKVIQLFTTHSRLLTTLKQRGSENIVEQEGHHGPVSLHWLICKIPSYQTLKYLGNGLTLSQTSPGFYMSAV